MRSWQWRIFEPICAIPQRGSGTNPTGLYLHDGHVVRLSLYESGWIQGIASELVETIAHAHGINEAQSAVGDSLNGFLLSALAKSIKRTLDQYANPPTRRWRFSR